MGYKFIYEPDNSNEYDIAKVQFEVERDVSGPELVSEFARFMAAVTYSHQTVAHCLREVAETIAYEYNIEDYT